MELLYNPGIASVMAAIIIISVIVLLVTLIKKRISENGEGQFSNLEGTEKKKNDFELSFLKIENKEKNTIYSPLSIKYALYLLRDAAEGNTSKQIENFVGKKTDAKKYETIINPEDKLAVANAIFIRKSFKENIKKDYVQKIYDKYNAEVYVDTFKSGANINEWIKNNTFGMIKDIVNDKSVSELDMILLNAILIGIRWKNQFNRNKSYGRIFHLTNGLTMKAAMLYSVVKTDSISYYKDDDIMTVSMDLEEVKDNKLCFIAIMPNRIKLKDYIKEFTLNDLKNIEDNLKLTSEEKGVVKLYIPKFDYEYELSLKNDLIKLGIKDAFSGKANFSKLSNSKLGITDTVHRAKIEFKERGIKAAAVTKVEMARGAEPEYPDAIELNFNKPFLYFIKDKESGEIWFTGSLYRPSIYHKNRMD